MFKKAMKNINNMEILHGEGILQNDGHITPPKGLLTLQANLMELYAITNENLPNLTIKRVNQMNETTLYVGGNKYSCASMEEAIVHTMIDLFKKTASYQKSPETYDNLFQQITSKTLPSDLLSNLKNHTSSLNKVSPSQNPEGSFSKLIFQNNAQENKETLGRF